MCPSESPDDKLNPNDIAAQAAALALHLQSSGVSFLPRSSADNAAQWESHFQPPVSESPSESPSVSPGDSAGSVTQAATSSPATTSPSAAVRKPSTAKEPAAPVVADAIEATYDGAPLAAADRTSQLTVLSETVAACTRCEQLSACRTNTVFGEGSVTPRIVFFGEGPGADEDRSGRPFVGKAGQLLTKMIEACTLRRDDVYILNTVKCRPPGNRNPDPKEITNCREYFEQQLAILRPEYIVCLGAISTQTLLNSKLSVGRLRGKFHRYFESKVLVTYHPAYLLRNPDAKKAAWQDLQLMLRDAGINL